MASCAFISAFDDLICDAVVPFVTCSQQIGSHVAEIAALVKNAFNTQRDFLVAASVSKQPPEAQLAGALEKMGLCIKDVLNFRESHRTSPFFNHLSAVSDSIAGLSWVAVAPAPGPYVKEMGDAAAFYTNRVLKDYRDKDKTHVTWVQLWTTVFKELQAYIKTHHTTGLSWNPRGGCMIEALKQSQGAAPAGVPPPPPPGVPPPPPMVKFEAKAPVDDGRNKLFDDINKGLDITSSLKKVSDDQKTHKNPNLREGAKPEVKDGVGVQPNHKANAVSQKLPRMELEGKKWFVEYQKNQPNILLDDCKMEHSIYMYRCENTVVQLKGKANSVIMDSCKKCSVVFENLVSSCEIVNCQSCKMQVMGKVATVSIEKTDGCQVYLSKDSLGVEIITAKSSEMNVMIPKADGEFAECPVPEQFKTTIDGTRLRTIITEKKA